MKIKTILLSSVLGAAMLFTACEEEQLQNPSNPTSVNTEAVKKAIKNNKSASNGEYNFIGSLMGANEVSFIDGVYEVSFHNQSEIYEVTVLEYIHDNSIDLMIANQTTNGTIRYQIDFTAESVQETHFSNNEISYSIVSSFNNFSVNNMSNTPLNENEKTKSVAYLVTAQHSLSPNNGHTFPEPNPTDVGLHWYCFSFEANDSSCGLGAAQAELAAYCGHGNGTLSDPSTSCLYGEHLCFTSREASC